MSTLAKIEKDEKWTVPATKAENEIAGKLSGSCDLVLLVFGF